MMSIIATSANRVPADASATVNAVMLSIDFYFFMPIIAKIILTTAAAIIKYNNVSEDDGLTH